MFLTETPILTFTTDRSLPTTIYKVAFSPNRNMRIWLACFFVLFALAELFDWVKKINLNLPLPIYILGGAFLAVVSNYDKIVGSYLSDTGSNVIRDILPQQPQLETTSIPSIPNQKELQLPDTK